MPADVQLAPRKIPRQRRSKALVEAIVEATARVLAEEGYSGANTNRIAEVAGVSVGSLYQYFPGKDALVMAVARRHTDEMTALLTRTAAEAAAGRAIPDVVRTFVRGMLDAHAMDPALHQALTEQMLHLGLGHFAETQAQIRGLVRAWLERHRGEILPRDLGAAAFTLVATVEGVVHSALLEEPARLEDPAFERELVAMVLRYLLGEGSW